MNTKNVKLFDANNKLADNFDEEVENILKSVHGENYYDTDEALVDTNLIKIPVMEEVYKDDELEKTMEIVDKMVDKNAPKINIVATSNAKKNVSFKDFIPLLFFILIFAVIVVAGYYFLNTFDFTSLLK